MKAVDDVVHGRLLADHGRDLTSAHRGELRALARDAAPLLPGRVLERAVERVEARIRGLGPLEPILADSGISEVMVNGGGAVWVERHGELLDTGLRLDEPTVLLLIERVVSPLGLHVDRSNPVADARLADGSRVHAIIRPLAVDGPCLTIRRFGARRIELHEICGPGVASLLRWAVGARLNILVAGGAGAGKTTLLNALAAYVPRAERVITVEDAAELRLPGPHVVRLESRPANAEGVGEVRIRDLVRSALRMRPDRLVVGEIRGGEALDMLQAMNTGHDGSLSTCHANSPADAVRRLETLVLMSDVALPLAAVREQIASALDLVVQVARRPGGRRAVVALDELASRPATDGTIGTRPLMRSGRLEALPRRPARGDAPSPDPGWVGA
ncbi:CpaF family protein [Rhabdothermincola sp.]|uniref:CpaF family protein n=1 Tax=Rhabdothermincola sp. TaxID=2820405 RepID=UPI002FE1B6E4